MSLYGRKSPTGLPRISSAGRPLDRGLLLLDEEIERLRHNRSAPPAGASHSASGFVPSPPPGKKILQDLNDQVKLFKSELEKKDKLIQDLSRADLSTPKHRKHVSFDEQYDMMHPRESILRSSYESTTLAKLQLRNEQLVEDLDDTKTKLLSRDIQLKELNGEIERLNGESSRQSSLILSLRARIGDMQLETGSVEEVQARGQYTIETLQSDAKHQQGKVLELEARVRKLLQEREDAERRTQTWERKYNDVFLNLQGIINTEDQAPEEIARKVSGLIQENLTLRGKLATLEENIHSSELESKASRETIQRLVAEMNRDQRNNMDTNKMVEKFRLERDAALQIRNELERENSLLKERMNASRRAWDSTQHELNDHENKMTSLGKEAKELKYEADVAKSELKSFRESLALLLSRGNSLSSCDTREDSIKERIKQLQIDASENSTHVSLMETKIKNLTEQLDSQANLHQAAIKRAKEAQDDFVDQRARLKQVETSLATDGVLLDNLRSERQKYMAFLEKVAAVMKLETIALDLGFDLNGDAIIARAEQLVRNEGDGLADKTTHVYSLQRKLKTMKQQLESKDLHLDLLRKKITQLEESLAGRSSLQKERDDTEWSRRKILKENDRLKGELSTAKRLIIDMKAQMLDVSNLKLTSMHQFNSIDELEKSLDKMEKTKDKQARKIAGMKQELEFTEHEANELHHRAEHSVKALSEDLQATKALLIEVQRRERQLVDFRQVIARMLGMDITTLAVPDYEIISRLEKLIQAHHSHAITAYGLDESLQNMERGFRQGYEEASALVGTTRRARSRSVSPTRRRKHQPEVY
ncbi:coiled-coil domain-containing protein 170-like isoform X1 [Asterias rubens]|uniref:coiled-coil domain-containing protein 170-like isoform X1 n=2 Tax=Asterias rubens TaxID=7604 RepID=UPI001455A847|nr:coiled-coil domain-containing protein 170-like isoform X1 [Asterias rubens]